MEGFGLNYVISKAQFLLILIIVISFLGVIWHVWLTRRISFVDFSKDEDAKTRRTKEIARLLLPMGLIVVVCIVLPILFVYQLYGYELKDLLEDPDITDFLKLPWSVLLPAKAWELTLFFDAMLGGLLYWVIGGLISIFAYRGRR